MSYLNYPDGLRSIDSLSPIDTRTIQATCPAMDCPFDGDVEAEAWLIATGLDGITVEYQWVCECGLEVVEDREHRYGDDN
jgi:hypothetical protein